MWQYFTWLLDNLFIKQISFIWGVEYQVHVRTIGWKYLNSLDNKIIFTHSFQLVYKDDKRNKSTRKEHKPHVWEDISF